MAMWNIKKEEKLMKQSKPKQTCKYRETEW